MAGWLLRTVGEGEVHVEFGQLAVHVRKRLTDEEMQLIRYDEHIAARDGLLQGGAQ